jgi:hypothetical protein
MENKEKNYRYVRRPSHEPKNRLLILGNKKSV